MDIVVKHERSKKIGEFLWSNYSQIFKKNHPDAGELGNPPRAECLCPQSGMLSYPYKYQSFYPHEYYREHTGSAKTHELPFSPLLQVSLSGNDSRKNYQNCPVYLYRSESVWAASHYQHTLG